MPLQQALRHLQGAFTNFFAKRAKYPTFKSKKGSRASAEYTRSAFRYRDGELTLAKMAEPLDIVWSRPLPDGAEPSTVTVSQDAAGRWFVSLLCEVTVHDARRPMPWSGSTRGSRRWSPVHRGEDHQPAARAPRPAALAQAQRGSPARQKGRRTGPRPGGRSPRSTPGSPTGAVTTCTS